MKNLKKLISVVLCLAMMASFLVVGASAASYGDVDETKAYYADVELLSALDILKGDENGNFNPDAEIKRSEFAAVVCRALAQESAATSTVSKFADVASNHWAVGYIGWAAGKQIVNGYEDGTFQPDKAVTAQEAIKMLMCAMGYGPLAESESYGGYPYGYLSLAGTYGVTDGVSFDPTAPASRGLVSQLVANALEAPLMAKSNTGYFEAYIVYDGSKTADYEERTILSQYLDIIKVRADVVANYKSEDSLLKKDGRQQVKLDITKVYNESDKEDYEEYLYDADDYLATGVAVYVGETDAADYLASSVDAYMFFNEDDDLELKAIIANTKTTESLTVEKDIEVAAVDTDKETVTFEYWEDIDSDSKTTEVDVAYDATVYVNGEAIGTLKAKAAARTAFEALAADGFEGKVEFVGSKGNDFSNIFITKYEYAQVEDVNVEAEAIELTDGYIEFSDDVREKGFTYTIYKDGEEISLADIKADDVLTFVYPGEDRDKCAYIDIYVSDATIEGTVNNVSASGEDFKIDGVEYLATANAKIKIGATGIFYLTHDGKVYDSKATSVLSDNYAYILKVGATESFGENTYQMRLFLKDGSIATYDVAEKLQVTEYVEADKEIDTITYKASDGDQDALFDKIEGYLAAADTEAAAQEAASMRLITFATSGNEINKISFAAEEGKDGDDFNKKAAGPSYKASTGKLGNYYFDENTAVFYAPVSKVTDDKSADYNKYIVDIDDVALISSNSFDEELSYTAFAYATDAKVMGATLVVSDLGFAGKSNALAVVTSVATGLNAENEKATTVTVFQSGAKETYALDEDVDLEIGDALKEGDIIQFVVNGAGEISQAEIVFDGDLTEYADGVTADASDISFVAGFVVDYEKGAYVLDADIDDANGVEYTFNYEAGCTLAMVTEAKAGTNSYVTNVSSTSGFKYTNTKSAAPIVYYMVARLDDGDIVDAVEYNLGELDLK